MFSESCALQYQREVRGNNNTLVERTARRNSFGSFYKIAAGQAGVNAIRLVRSNNVNVQPAHICSWRHRLSEAPASTISHENCNVRLSHKYGLAYFSVHALDKTICPSRPSVTTRSLPISDEFPLNTPTKCAMGMNRLLRQVEIIGTMIYLFKA